MGNETKCKELRVALGATPPKQDNKDNTNSKWRQPQTPNKTIRLKANEDHPHTRLLH